MQGTLQLNPSELSELIFNFSSLSHNRRWAFEKEKIKNPWHSQEKRNSFSAQAVNICLEVSCQTRAIYCSENSSSCFMGMLQSTSGLRTAKFTFFYWNWKKWREMTTWSSPLLEIQELLEFLGQTDWVIASFNDWIDSRERGVLAILLILLILWEGRHCLIIINYCEGIFLGHAQLCWHFLRHLQRSSCL